MISQASITNFKCLRDVKIDLERFTIFVGPNASGKSSILQALDLLCRAFETELVNGFPYQGIPGGYPSANDAKDQNVEGEVSNVLSRGSKGPVELLASVSGKQYRYRSQTPNSPFNFTGDKWDGEGQGVASPTENQNNWRKWIAVPNGVNVLPRSVLLRLEASKLVVAIPTQDPSVMAPDGSGLHIALAGMALNDPDSWQELQLHLRRIIPSIRRLRHTKATQREPATLLFDTLGADSLPANQVSEGTLLVLGLLAALHATGRPNLILLDDLDRGLHPKAQKELISLLRGLLETYPDLQLIATTHSPYMLDCMSTHEVRMTYLREDGATICAPLSNHPKFEKWKVEMAPGEMWSMFGEKWLVDSEASR